MFKKFMLLLLLCVHAFSFSQTVSTVTDGNFYDSIDRDSQGNIYCSDFFGGSVYKYDINGNVTTFKSGLTNPNGISINGQDEIFVCDAGANTIFRYDVNGTELSSYSNNINNPTGIRNIPGTTSMLFVEYNNATLKRLEVDGTVTTLFSGTPLNGPSGLAIVNDKIYVSNYNDRTIMEFEDTRLNIVTQLPASAANSNFLGFITASNSAIYATQLGEHRIYQIDPTTGNSSVYAGSSLGNMDGDISSATFNFPNGIYADTDNDRLYVSDAGTSNLRIIENVTLSTSNFEANNLNVTIVNDQVSDSLQVNATLKSSDKVTIKIFEITGKKVFTKEYPNPNVDFSETIEKSTLSSGVYVVLFHQKHLSFTKKIAL